MKPDKITIEVTQDKYTVTVFEGDKVISTRSDSRNGSGFESNEKGDIVDDFPENLEEFAENIDESISFTPFELANELRHVADGDYDE